MNRSITVQLTGNAHMSFDIIHSLLENDVLTITSRSTSIPKEVIEKKRPLKEGDAMTIVGIVADPETDLFSVVNKAISQINALYPASARIID